MKMHKLIVVISIGTLCGCQYAQVSGEEKTECPVGESERSETLSAYLDLCKEIAAKGKPDGWKADWSVRVLRLGSAKLPIRSFMRMRST